MSKPIISDEAIAEIRAVSEANRNKNKPLSETHPTLMRHTKYPEDWEGSNADTPYSGISGNLIQSCTVDVAEHERLKAEVERFKKLAEDWQAQSDSWLTEARAYKAEIERLKKEHERVCGEYDDMIRRMPSIDEHETMLKNWAEVHKKLTDSEAEVERLKKELSDMGERAVRDMYDENCEGIVEGERRAMERVQSVLLNRLSLWWPSGASENRAECISKSAEIQEIAKALGLGEEEQR